MKAAEIRGLTLEDIKGKLAEEKAKYEKLRLNHKTSQIEQPIQLRAMRKTIARLNTELTKKQVESQSK